MRRQLRPLIALCPAPYNYTMHLSLSSIGGTREEQLCILSAVLLWGVVAWLFTMRAARKTVTTSRLTTTTSRRRCSTTSRSTRSGRACASRVARPPYVLAIYYAICFLVSVRYDCSRCPRG